MDGQEISVYGEAKGEYTRQLCVFLAPCLETYFLRLLDEARSQAESSQKYLWTFQNLLQCIPDWNQDKVVRETEVIQKDCKCDYLEELLTAVFIAHTKVLSAIRLSTKQKKLQITIPKIDHFLHRVLSECARTLWTNAFLFVDTSSIEKQKNLRQVSGLIHDSILQAIRGLLPVRTILREYLHEDDEEGGDTPVAAIEPIPLVTAEEHEEPPKATVSEEPPKETVSEEPPKATEAGEVPKQPMIYIDTKPSVSFAQEHVMFDSNTLEANEIHDLPFAEAETRVEQEEEEDLDKIKITDEVLTMDADEILS
ncbi:MAG: hypothetical protein EBT09_14850 [Actinobacteria bacterium]|nr:hypothetical protein [Actinomycetota bacterium]